MGDILLRITGKLLEAIWYAFGPLILFIVLLYLLPWGLGWIVLKFTTNESLLWIDVFFFGWWVIIWYGGLLSLFIIIVGGILSILFTIVTEILDVIHERKRELRRKKRITKSV